MAKKKSLAYLAGLFDGEGSFSMNPQQQKGKTKNWQFAPQMSISLTFGFDVLENFCSHFGGELRSDSQGGMVWRISDKVSMRKAVTNLYPHLYTRRDSAYWFMCALSEFPKHPLDREPGAVWPASVWYPKRLISVAEKTLAVSWRERKSQKKPKIVSLIEYLEENGHYVDKNVRSQTPSILWDDWKRSDDWIAGLFDAEGSFSIQVNIRRTKNGREHVHFNPTISMNMKLGGPTLQHLVDRFGGRIYSRKNYDTFQWSINQQDRLIIVAQELLGMGLVVKAQTAEKFIKTLELFPTQRANHLSGERTWDVERALKVAKMALLLNPNSASRSNHKDDVLGFLYRVKEIYKEKEIPVMVDEA